MYIWDGGNLTLVGTTIEFQSDASTVQDIIIEDGCSLQLMGGATITSNQTSSSYGFALEPSASLSIRASTIDRCGYGYGNPGFLVDVTTVLFENVIVTNAPIGLEVQVTIPVSTVTFMNCDIGLLVNMTSGVSISQLSFENVMTGIYLNSSSSCTIDGVSFEGCIESGVYLDSESGSCTIRNSLFVEIATTALVLNGDNNEVYLNAFVQNAKHINDTGLGNSLDNGTYGNLYWDYPYYDYDGDLLGDTSYDNSSMSDAIDVKLSTVHDYDIASKSKVGG
jgi:parallel beta-helix repeat protein